MVKSLSQGKVLFFGLSSAAATALLSLGPEEYGGTGDLHQKIKDIEARPLSKDEKERLIEKVRQAAAYLS